MGKMMCLFANHLHLCGMLAWLLSPWLTSYIPHIVLVPRYFFYLFLYLLGFQPNHLFFFNLVSPFNYVLVFLELPTFEIHNHIVFASVENANHKNGMVDSCMFLYNLCISKA
jgi:hypothetical protein